MAIGAFRARMSISEIHAVFGAASGCPRSLPTATSRPATGHEWRPTCVNTVLRFISSVRWLRERDEVKYLRASTSGGQNRNRRERLAVREQGEIEKHYSVYFFIDCGERHGARSRGSYDACELVREGFGAGHDCIREQGTLRVAWEAPGNRPRWTFVGRIPTSREGNGQ